MHGLINTDHGDRPQLVHHQYLIERPTRLIRFATGLGLAKGNKPMLQAVEQAFTFIARQYAPGDQVILVTWVNFKWETDPNAKALKLLARHLYDGTNPGDYSTLQRKNGRETANNRIPVYGAVVGLQCREQTESLSAWNNRLKFILPPGIKHIICYDRANSFRSCFTTFDLEGTIISRELRFLSDHSDHEPPMDVTKHVLYYREDLLPKWDRHQPVWTHVLSSPSHQFQDVFPLEPIESAEMPYHELRRYQGLPGINGDGSMLVWKSGREEPW